MPRKVLIVEDDKNIADLMRLYLEKESMDCQVANDGLVGLEKFQQFQPDLVMLDIMLPGMDGLSLCETIRRDDADIGIIIVSAKGQEADKIRGLSIGADDYITKPFNPIEVLARVKSQLRRYTTLGGKQSGDEQGVLRNGALVLDDAAKMVRVDGEVINLTPIEYNILHLLMKNPGRVYSTAQIYQLVWNDPVLGSENTVAVHIRHLREKIEIDPANPHYLKVVWGLGYKMEKMV